MIRRSFLGLLAGLAAFPREALSAIERAAPERLVFWKPTPLPELVSRVVTVDGVQIGLGFLRTDDGWVLDAADVLEQSGHPAMCSIVRLGQDTPMLFYGVAQNGMTFWRSPEPDARPFFKNVEDAVVRVDRPIPPWIPDEDEDEIEENDEAEERRLRERRRGEA
jgi:hypothetical protein